MHLFLILLLNQPSQRMNDKSMNGMNCTVKINTKCQQSARREDIEYASPKQETRMKGRRFVWTHWQEIIWIGEVLDNEAAAVLGIALLLSRLSSNSIPVTIL
jgi:hypothetical protein